MIHFTFLESYYASDFDATLSQKIMHLVIDLFHGNDNDRDRWVFDFFKKHSQFRSKHF